MPRLFRFVPAARRGRSARLLAALILAGLTVLGSVPAEARVFDPETFTLDNGLQVVVVTNRRAPIVTHMIWYKAGAADEAAGESGNAHFLEHLMFKGTDKLGPGEFSDIIALNGGRENAFTSYDYTGYYQTVARDRLEIVMQHEADRMTNLRLTDEVALPERDVILEERRSRVDNNPGARGARAQARHRAAAARPAAPDPEEPAGQPARDLDLLSRAELQQRRQRTRLRAPGPG